MNGEEKLHTREIYVPTEYPELMKKQSECLDLLFEYNSLRPSETEKKTALLKKMFAEIGEGCYIETPFHANFGGAHVHFGKNIYANFNLTLVDDTHIYVGDNTMFGPNVTLATAGHPVLPELREKGYHIFLCREDSYSKCIVCPFSTNECWTCSCRENVSLAYF